MVVLATQLCPTSPLLKNLSDVGIRLPVAVETDDLEWIVGPFKMCAFRQLAMEWTDQFEDPRDYPTANACCMLAHIFCALRSHRRDRPQPAGQRRVLPVNFDLALGILTRPAFCLSFNAGVSPRGFTPVPLPMSPGRTIEIIGGRTRTRTLDPLIKSHRKTVKYQD